MMDFHNINLPQWIESFAIARVEFDNNYIQTLSGREVRYSYNNRAKHIYIIQDCMLSLEQFQHFNNFFRARHGSYFAFRFKDYGDFQINRQIIAIGDDKSNEFQIFKQYDDPISCYQRNITKPIRDTVELCINNHVINDALINYDNGVISLDHALMQEHTLSVTCQFDTIVRFAQDSFDYNYTDNGSIALSTIKLIETNN